MAFWKWQTLADERVAVDRQDGAGMQVLGPNIVGGIPASAERVAQWTTLAAKYAEKYDVPISWILAVIMAESGGDPQAENFCCAGLMAIYYSVHGKKREDMLDPDKNVDYGTSLLARSREQGYDLPAVASMHVAGASGDKQGKLTPHGGACCSATCMPENCVPPKCVQHPDFPQGSPWGMCEHMHPRTDGDGSVGYIDRVVRFNNYWVERLSNPIDPPVEPPQVPSKAAIGGKALMFVLGAAAGFATLNLVLPKMR